LMESMSCLSNLFNFGTLNSFLLLTIQSFNCSLPLGCLVSFPSIHSWGIDQELRS
jgi:hypothetical protein